MPEPDIRHHRHNGTFWIAAGLVLTNVFWGASGVAVKIALLQLSTFEIVALRFIIATPFLLAITLLWKGFSALSINKKDLPYIALLAFLGIPLEFLLQVTSLTCTTATDFTLIFGLAPFFIIFVSALLLGEKITRYKLLGSLLAFIGIAFVITNGSLSVTGDFLGDGIALVAVFVWALYTVWGKTLNERYSALTVLNYTFVFGALECVPFCFLSSSLSPISFTESTWMAMGFLTFCCSIIAFFLYNHGVEKLPASTAGMFIYIQPLSGVLLASLVLGEPITAYTMIGIALIIYGIYEASRKRRNDIIKV